MKNLYIAEIRHQFGTRVYEISREELLERALDALDRPESLSEERLIREYFLQNNSHYIVEESFLNFIESIVLYKGHNEIALRNAFAESYLDISTARDVLKVLKTILIEDRLTGDESQLLYELFKPNIYNFNDLEIELLPMAFSTRNSDTTYGAEVRERTSSKIIVQGWELETI